MTLFLKGKKKRHTIEDGSCIVSSFILLHFQIEVSREKVHEQWRSWWRSNKCEGKTYQKEERNRCARQLFSVIIISELNRRYRSEANVQSELIQQVRAPAYIYVLLFIDLSVVFSALTFLRWLVILLEGMSRCLFDFRTGGRQTTCCSCTSLRIHCSGTLGTELYLLIDVNAVLINYDLHQLSSAVYGFSNARTVVPVMKLWSNHFYRLYVPQTHYFQHWASSFQVIPSPALFQSLTHHANGHNIHQPVGS